jgi:hypothetical protein
MKNCILTLLMFVTMPAAAAEAPGPLTLMNSYEFNFVQHSRAKHDYVKQITPILKQLGLKSVDLTKLSPEEVYEIIVREQKWDPLLNEVDALCADRKHASNCRRLANIRKQTFDYIRGNPEE